LFISAYLYQGHITLLAGFELHVGLREDILIDLLSRDVTEPAKIRIRLMRILCAKFVGCGFVAQ